MKRSLIDFFLTLVVSVVLFSAVAYFFVDYADGLMGDVMHKVEVNATEETSETGGDIHSTVDTYDPKKEKSTDKILTVLVVCADDSGKRADAIFLAGINSTKKTVTCSLIPSTSYISSYGIKQNIGDQLGNRGVSYIRDFVQARTGVDAQYYFVVNPDSISNLIDFIGGIEYDVPEDMYYSEPSQKILINLRKGKQTLDGNKVMQLLSYRGYVGQKEIDAPDGIGTITVPIDDPYYGTQMREEEQLKFVHAFCEAFFKPENIEKAKDILYNVYHNMDSDMTPAKFIELIDVIFNYPAYSSKAQFLRIPGVYIAGGYYSVSLSDATAIYKNYR